VVLLHDLESGCIWDFGVFCDFDAVAHLSSVYLYDIIAETHGFSPSSRTKSSNLFGAFITAVRKHHGDVHKLAVARKSQAVTNIVQFNTV
jgi:hypothetical protein